MKIKRSICCSSSILPAGFDDLLDAKSRIELLRALEPLIDQEIAEPVRWNEDYSFLIWCCICCYLQSINVCWRLVMCSDINTHVCVLNWYHTLTPIFFTLAPSQIDLQRCTALLNMIDKELEEITERGKNILFLSANSSDEPVPDTDIEDAKVLLSFTAYLLGNSMNKEVFSSSEVIPPLISV